MNFDRVVSAVMESQSISTADDPLIELQMPANSMAEIIRVEIGAAEGTDPVAEIQEIQLYLNDAVGTAGTGLTENIIRGEGPIVGVALRNLTAAGATPTEFYGTAFNARTGWLYLPVPDERPLLKAGGEDNFGVLFPTAPDVAMTFTLTVMWGEVG
jgi:hypothetical protein